MISPEAQTLLTSYLDEGSGPVRHDPVDHPGHYGGADNPYEAIKVIEAWSANWSSEPWAIFPLGAAIKYICRAWAKGKPIEDLKKARWYLSRVIEKLEAE